MPESERREMDDERSRHASGADESPNTQKRNTVMNRMKSYIGSIFYSRKSKVAPNLDLRQSVSHDD